MPTRSRDDTTPRLTLPTGSVPVPAAYQHHRRHLMPGPLLTALGICLKWYSLFPAGYAPSAAEEATARDTVTVAFGPDTIAQRGHGLGYVVHHASTELEYLLVGIWYQVQELWLTVDVRVRGSGEPFGRRQPGVDWSTACTWELAPIWHEREAWTRFLYAARDDAAHSAYLRDQANGLV